MAGDAPVIAAMSSVHDAEEDASTILIVNSRFPDLQEEAAVLAGCRLVPVQCEDDAGLAGAAQRVDGILVGAKPWISGRAMRAMPDLAVVCRYGIGVDNVDIDAATELGIAVCNVPDYAVDEVATHALTLGLALLRRVAVAAERTRTGAWSVSDLGSIEDVRATVLGIVGFGAIGRRLGEKALGVGLQVKVHDPFVDEAAIERSGCEPASFGDLLATADLVSLHMPLTPETRGMMGADALAQMKPTAYVVNTARGGLVDETALTNALEAGRLGGAALDVLTTEPPGSGHPLLGRSDVIVTPHMAWYSEQALGRVRRGAAEQVRAVLAGEVPTHLVNRFAPRPSTGRTIRG